MEPPALTGQDWRIRLFIYHFFVEHERPPTFSEAAASVGIDEDEARAAYRRLAQHHQICVASGTDRVLMAPPLSAVPTLYRVTVRGRRLWANCAWDALGIAAMLEADAGIEARHPLSGEGMALEVRQQELNSTADLQDARVHFSLPVRDWYDDLLHT